VIRHNGLQVDPVHVGGSGFGGVGIGESVSEIGVRSIGVNGLVVSTFLFSIRWWVIEARFVGGDKIRTTRCARAVASRLSGTGGNEFELCTSCKPQRRLSTVIPLKDILRTSDLVEVLVEEVTTCLL